MQEAHKRRDDGLTPELVERVESGLDQNRRADVRRATSRLHVSDLADLIELLRSDRRKNLVAALETSLDPYVLNRIDQGVQGEVLAAMSPARLAAALGALDAGDAFSLIETLNEDQQERVIQSLSPAERRGIKAAAAWPESSAGRLMQRELVAAPPEWTVGRLIDRLRNGQNLPNDFHDVYIIDRASRPIGALPVSRVMRASREKRLQDIMKRTPRLVPAHLDQEETANLFRKDNLVSAPVVNRAGKLIGVVTADDIFEVITEEASEDIKRLGGVGGDSLSDTVLAAARGRVGWLFVNLLTALMASLVIAVFESAIARMAALAILMPVVASMGGVAGTQTLTIAVRALATNDLVPANRRRVIWREAAVGFLNGALFAGLLGLAGGFWFANVLLGLVLFAALIVNMIAAALAGILIPLGLERAGADPAIASSVFVTTVTDVIGFFAFLGLAAWLLL